MSGVGEKTNRHRLRCGGLGFVVKRWALVEVANRTAEFGDNRFERRGGLGIILLVEVVNGVAGVEDGGVGAVEGAAHFGGRAVGEFAAEKNGNLAGNGDVLFAAFTVEVLDGDVVVGANGFLDVQTGEFDDGVFFCDEVFQNALFEDVHGDGFAVAREHARVVHRAGEGSFEGSHATGDLLGDEVEDVVVEGDVREGAQFHLEDVEARFVGGHIDVCADAALKTADQAVHQVGNVLWGAVTGHHDLALVVFERVKNVEEFVLKTFALGHKLDIVNQEDVNGAEFATEGFFVGVSGPRSDVFVEEGFGGGVANDEIGIELTGEVADSVHQVGLANTGGAIEEERVGMVGIFVGARTISSVLRHKTGHSQREAVVGALHEGFEGHLLVDGLGRILRFLGNGRIDVHNGNVLFGCRNVLEVDLHASRSVHCAQGILDEVGELLGELRGVFVLGKFHRQSIVSQGDALAVHPKVVHHRQFSKDGKQMITDTVPQRLSGKRFICIHKTTHNVNQMLKDC